MVIYQYPLLGVLGIISCPIEYHSKYVAHFMEQRSTIMIDSSATQWEIYPGKLHKL
jgi:hypothetical protein